MKIRSYISLIVVTALFACNEIPVETVYYDFDDRAGVFISCEGNFMYGNASLTFYDKKQKQVFNQIFYARNNAPLGDVAQSVVLAENTLFTVVNNSGKIYGLDPTTSEFRGVITGLTSPRYMHQINKNKAYVSDLYARSIAIVDPENYTITGEINVSDGNQNSGRHSTEQLVQLGKWVFVSCWSNDEYILVIDSETDELVDSIKVPLQPKDILVDKNNKIWTMTDGSYQGSVLGNESPKLIRIDPVTRTIEQIYTFSGDSDNPSSLAINSTKDTLVFVLSDIWKMPVGSRTLPETSFIPSVGRLFYSLSVDPENDEIYAADAIDYSQSAIIYRYSNEGNLIDSFKVGINPSDYCFK